MTRSTLDHREKVSRTSRARTTLVLALSAALAWVGAPTVSAVTARGDVVGAHPATVSPTTTSTTVRAASTPAPVTGELRRILDEGAAHTGGEKVHVDVDGTRIPVAARLAAGLRGGTQVALRVTASPAVLARYAGADGRWDGVELQRALTAGAATITALSPYAAMPAAPSTSSGRPPTAGALDPGYAEVAGTHTLTVVPVYWGTSAPPAGSPDATTFAQTITKTDTYWSTTTEGRVRVAPGTIHPWTAIADPLSNGLCDDAATSRIEDAVRKLAGDSAFGDHKHVMAYFPRTSGCGWAGLGYLHGDFIWINGDLTALDHELGHNLGLGHGGLLRCWTDTTRTTATSYSDVCDHLTYLDDYDVMGGNRAGSNTSSAHLDDLGLMPSDQVVDVNGSATVTLAPRTAGTGVRLVRFAARGHLYAVEYRTAVGLDSWLGNLNNAPGTGVIIREIQPDDRSTGEHDVIDAAPVAAAGERTLPAFTAGQTFTTPGAAGTAASVRVVAADSSGATLAVTAPADSTAPSRATLDQVIPSNDHVYVSWTPGTDAETGVTWQCVLVDGACVTASTSGTTSTAWIAVPDGRHTISVRTRNGAGRVSDSTEVTTLIDNTPAPAPTITSPRNGTVVASMPLTLTWTQPTDPESGVKWTYLTVDGGTGDEMRYPLGGPLTSATVDWLEPGRHTLAVVSVNGVDAWSTSAPITVTYDATAPVAATWVSPSADLATRSASVPLRWTAGTDAESGIASVSVEDNGTVITTSESASTTSYELPLSEGVHRVRILTRNRAGQMAASTTRAITKDSLAPAVQAAPTAHLRKAAATATGVPVTTSWTVSDAAGIDAQSLQYGSARSVSVTASARSLDGLLASGIRISARLAVRDRAGNAVTVTGASVLPAVDALSRRSSAYTGRWSTVSGRSYLGGTEQITSAKGAALRYTTTAREIGLVATGAPSRGTVNVIVDGHSAGTISLTAKSTTASRVVWTRSWPSTGTHTITLVNAGVRGRPTIGVDALVRLS